jgi:hypothetical protein
LYTAVWRIERRRGRRRVVAESRTSRWWGLAATAWVLFGVVAAFLRVETPVDIGRPRGMRHRVECLLEKWGVIPVDPFRHVEG